MATTWCKTPYSSMDALEVIQSMCACTLVALYYTVYAYARAVHVGQRVSHVSHCCALNS